jgi:hypothetical protein
MKDWVGNIIFVFLLGGWVVRWLIGCFCVIEVEVEVCIVVFNSKVLLAFFVV